jgi:hypothetical protein
LSWLNAEEGQINGEEGREENEDRGSTGRVGSKDSRNALTFAKEKGIDNQQWRGNFEL